MLFITTSGRFVPGRLVATPAVLEAVPMQTLLNAYGRHLRCDWGEVCPGDWERNNEALHCGERLFSVYCTADQQRFWIITEADRSATTILLPKDY